MTNFIYETSHPCLALEFSLRLSFESCSLVGLGFLIDDSHVIEKVQYIAWYSFVKASKSSQLIEWGGYQEQN